jgi:hypothetical protein
VIIAVPMLNEAYGAENESPARLHRIAIPDSLSWVITVVPQIELAGLVAFLVFEDPTHR